MESSRPGPQANRRGRRRPPGVDNCHAPGNCRHTYGARIGAISRRSLPSLDRTAPSLAARARLIIVRSLVQIQAELSRFLSGMRFCAAVSTVRAAREAVVRSSSSRIPRSRAEPGRTSRTSSCASTSTSRLHAGARAGDQACDMGMPSPTRHPPEPADITPGELRSPEHRRGVGRATPGGDDRDARISRKSEATARRRRRSRQGV